jgi:NhaA family Na+:H+ antiporter
MANSGSNDDIGAWQRVSEQLRAFIRLESAAGLVLMGAAVLGLVIDNSPLRAAYDALLSLEGEVRIGALAVEKPVLLWVNDLWMAVFFFLVSMEIKQETIDGYLSDRKGLILPAMAAVGGIAAPAAIFVAMNWGDAAALQGWAIPTATDIAFALGVLALLGRAVPPSLKVFLVTLAVLDDLAAIVIIAVFYSAQLAPLSLALAAIGIAALLVMNWLGVTRVAAYALVGIALWVCVLKSGVHATLAGVALGFAIPGRAARGEAAPLKSLIHALHPWVAFGILPAFAFVNSGIDLATIDARTLQGGVPAGIALGLFIGKPLGVFALTWLTVKFGLAELPPQTRWLHVLGLAVLCGVGFTMSLFIGSLAYEEAGARYAGTDRLGIIVGSVASGIVGYWILRRAASSGNGND